MKAQTQAARESHRPKQRLLSLREAATYLGCSRDSIRELVYSGKLPVHRHGKKWYFDIRDLDAFIDDGKQYLVARPDIKAG